MHKIHTERLILKTTNISFLWSTIWLKSHGSPWWNLKRKYQRKFANDMHSSVWKRKKKQPFLKSITSKNIKNSIARRNSMTFTWKLSPSIFLKKMKSRKNIIVRLFKWHGQCWFGRSCLKGFETRQYASSIISKTWCRLNETKKNRRMNYEMIVSQMSVTFENSNVWYTYTYRAKSKWS